MDIAFVKLIVFVIWVGVIMFLTAKPGVKSYNREFSGLFLTAALLFYESVGPEIFATALLAFMGFRTYQKKINTDKANTP